MSRKADVILLEATRLPRGYHKVAEETRVKGQPRSMEGQAEVGGSRRKWAVVGQGGSCDGRLEAGLVGSGERDVSLKDRIEMMTGWLAV